MQSPQTPTTINRINYGVIFQEENKIVISKEYWLHTFKIDLPKPVHFHEFAPCGSDAECITFNDYLKSINNIHFKTASHVNETLKNIHSLMPKSDILRTMKTKRALLSFVGSLSKSLFGTATMDDVNILARHINQLTRTTILISKTLQQHGSVIIFGLC